MNKVMKKYKNRQFHFSGIDVPMIIFVIVVTVGSLFVWRDYEKISDKFNISKTSVTHIVQTPSEEQVSELSSCEEILSVIPYFFSSCELGIDGKTIKSDLFLIEDYAQLDKTLFSNNLQKSIQEPLMDNPICIDTILADKYGIVVGDDIKLICGGRSLSCVVNAIYGADGRHDTGMIMAELTGEVKQTVDPDGVLKYSGAYISSTDEIATDKRLKDYKPLGDLRTRDEFDSDELYQAYLDLRNEADSTQTTFYRKQYLSDLQKRYDSSLMKDKILFAIMVVIEMVVICTYFVIRPRKYIKKDILKDVRNNFKIEQEKEMLGTYNTISLVLYVGAVIITLAIMMVVFDMNYILWLQGSMVIIPAISILFARVLVNKRLKYEYEEAVKKNQESRRNISSDMN